MRKIEINASVSSSSKCQLIECVGIFSFVMASRVINAQFEMCVMQELWERECRLYYCHSKVAEMAVGRICTSRDINVSYSFAIAQNNYVSPKTQTTVAKMLEKMKFAWRVISC